MKFAILALFQLFLFSPAWAVLFTLDGVYSPQETAIANQALTTVQDALPPRLKFRLNYTIHVTFTNMNSDEDRKHLGRADYWDKSIILNSNFLKPNDPQYSTDTLVRTLAHEIAHFYDHQNFEEADFVNQRKICKNLRNNRKEKSGPEPLCNDVLYKTTTISTDPEFMALTSWLRGDFSAQNINSFQRRLPDPYAVSDIKESFPVYFESYLFDRQFACKLPAVEAYFNKAFMISKSSSCSKDLTWYFSGQENAFRTVPKDRIWAIDYFWAEAGAGAASGFGHSMLRLVICKPDRPPGPDCYKDFDQHIVLSFGAATATGAFSNYAGITGKYPLNLYAMTFYSAKSQYNVTELRDLYAIPLKLTPQQKNQLLDQLYSLHWNFDSNYYFTNRNCTTEISRALLAAGISLDTMQTLKTENSPSGFLNHLFYTSLTYPNMKTIEDIRKNPFLYFSSSQKNVDAALKIVSKAMGISLSSIEDYLKKVDDQGFEQLLSKTSHGDRLLYATYYLETIRANRLQSALITEELSQDREKAEKLKSLVTEGSQLNFSYRFIGSFLSRTSYGNPNPAEVDAAQKDFHSQTKSIIENLKNRTQNELESINPSSVALSKARQRLERLNRRL
ncbi:MAG: DUF4105 domain-containing protein [Bdellovibrio sp.]|nr:DUF4105 domain-containing protein [Bdellovibrio sp.]